VTVCPPYMRGHTVTSVALRLPTLCRQCVAAPTLQCPYLKTIALDTDTITLFMYLHISLHKQI
jgi:hypothetical protein